jgi:hypothetical protein
LISPSISPYLAAARGWTIRRTKIPRSNAYNLGVAAHFYIIAIRREWQYDHSTQLLYSMVGRNLGDSIARTLFGPVAEIKAVKPAGK